MQHNQEDETVINTDIPQYDESFNAYLTKNKDSTKIQINKNSFTIGRTTGCSHVVNDKIVSRIHCRIVKLPNSFIIEDLGSSNGTKVNDLPIKKKVLKNNDKITLSSSTTFTFHQEE